MAIPCQRRGCLAHRKHTHVGMRRGTRTSLARRIWYPITNPRPKNCVHKGSNARMSSLRVAVASQGVFAPRAIRKRRTTVIQEQRSCQTKILPRLASAKVRVGTARAGRVQRRE